MRLKTSSPLVSSFLGVGIMPNPIETDFKLALALGRIAGRWGQAEFAVELIYIMLAEMPHRKATISFSFHKAVNTQKDIIWFLADETPWIDDAERAETKASVKAFADMSATRNGWVHYPFGVDSSSPDLEIYKAKRSRKGDLLYSKEPASARLAMQFANEVSALTERLYKAHRTLSLAYDRKLAAPHLDQIQSKWSLTPPKPLGLPPKP